ncbi:cell envelope integrity protein TolA [Candidatus Gillettellia adelgis]
MIQENKKNNTLKLAIVVSSALHLMMLILLIFSSFKKNIITTNNKSSEFNIVMVDSNPAVDQLNSEKQLSNNSQYTKQSHPIKFQKQAEQLKTQLHKTQKKSNIVKAKPDTFAIGYIKKNKNAKIKDAALRAQTTIDATQPSLIVDGLINSLLNTNNITKTVNQHRQNKKTVEIDKTKVSTITNVEINRYMRQIQLAIQSKFYNSDLFSSKHCELRITLASNGKLLNVQEIRGNPALCQTAISAATLAQIPPPPNDTVYQYFKNFTLGFKPQ